MRHFGPLSVALLGAVACSVYSENLLTDAANSNLGGSLPDSGTPDVSSSGSGAISGSSGSGSSGSGSGGTSGSGGKDAGPDVPDIGEGGCVGIGSGGAEGLDCCPMDTMKTDPGLCGCGVPDDTDGDTDGTPDCIDACPMDGAKTAPGTCGCGFVDATCAELGTALIHRYSFGGTGTEATDSIGGAHGTVVDGMLSGGAVVLAGLQTNQHVDLPDGLISALSNATFEIWSSWAGGSNWQRLFDFGDQNTGGSMTGYSYIFLTPLNSQGTARLVYRKPAGTEIIVNDTALFPSVVQSHVAVVVDETGGTLSLYVNGLLKGSIAFPDSLSLLQDTNNWLGRSNYNVDPEYSGSITEFRIYNAALSEAQVGLSFELGPDPLFLAQ